LVALHLGVALGRARRDRAVGDGVSGEQLAQAAVAGVGQRVVGLQASRGDAVRGEERKRSLDERGHGRGLLVAVDLGERQAAVVVDHRVTELPAHAGALLGAGAEPIGGHGVPGPAEAGQALGVHLQQITGARPLIALDGLARRRRPARQPAPHQAARDRGVRHPELRSDQPRTPTGPPARRTHAVMDLLADASRLTMRRRGMIGRPRPGRPLGVARGAVAADPVLHRRDAHAPPRRGLVTTKPMLQTELDELDPLPTGQPPTLVLHPG
jgi:hypothetical protein